MAYIRKKEYRNYEKYELEDMLYNMKSVSRRNMESGNLEMMVKYHNLMMDEPRNQQYKIEYQKYQLEVADDRERYIINKLFFEGGECSLASLSQELFISKTSIS